jgi:CheY-like chemotaxis protein
LPGQGSLFTIFLPSLSEPAPHTSASISAKFHSQAAGAAGTVLIIEDEEPLRLAFSKMLRKRGFDVIEASDGREGVNLFRAHEPAIDAVLLDMTLPRLSGREVLRELRDDSLQQGKHPRRSRWAAALAVHPEALPAQRAGRAASPGLAKQLTAR